jgi:hypothetical protein
MTEKWAVLLQPLPLLSIDIDFLRSWAHFSRLISPMAVLPLDS